MSKRKNDSSFSGVLGESSTIRQVRGKLVVKNRPAPHFSKPTRKDPAKKKAAQARFREAVQYARQQVSIPESKALYAARVTAKMRSASLLAMTDYLSAPKVHSIETLTYHGVIGDEIIVKATDDFMVTKVKLILTNPAGALIETGEAQPDSVNSILWVYKATVANPTLAGTHLRAVAYDRPGNKGTEEIVL